MTRVEETLRMQREMWRVIGERTSKASGIELPPDPPRRILLFGIGSSYHAAKLSGFALIRDRQRQPKVPVIACSSMEIGVEVQPAKGDWAFAFSHRGKTPVTLEALEACQRVGAFTVLVAGEGAQEPDFARMVLRTSPVEKVEPHTVSVTGAVCAVTSLLLGLKVLEEWDALRSLGDPNLDLLRERVGKPPSVLVGEWEGEWLAREGALKFMEMARLPVRFFGTEEFFHGPKISVGPEDSVWHISLPKDRRSQEVAAARRISVPGSSPLAWVPALLELQWAALAVALNLGVDPDLGAV